MKNLARLLVLFSLTVFVSGQASARPVNDKANSRALSLIARLKASPHKHSQIAAAPILNFSLSPSTALQGQKVSAYIQSDNNFVGRELSVDTKVNGVAKGTTYSPSRGLFVLPLGLQTEARTSSIEATLYLENTQNNVDVRNAVKALDVDIRRLTTSVNSERDATKRKILESQRSEKLALKNELLAQLKKFRYKVGTQTYSYKVQPDSSSPTLPKVSAIAPSSGDVRGGTKVIFSGSNFSPNFSVFFGGVLSPSVTYVNETTVFAYTPDMGLQTGIKDVELRFNVSGLVSNVVIPGAYFATNVVPAPPQKPIAIASGSQRIRLGETADLDGSQSYANRQTALGYVWKVVSAPNSSSYTPGQTLGTTQSISIEPSALGAYVLSLTVTELDTSEHLVSDLSIVQVYVGNAPEPEAAAIVLQRGDSGTSQIIANDPDFGGARLYSILTPPVHGTASVSSAGLVTYVAGSSFIGQDPFTIRVTNQSGLHGDVIMQVKIVEFNQAPTPSAPGIETNTEPGTTQITPGSPNQNLTHTYSIVVPPSHGTASVSASGLVNYASSSGYVGADSMIVKVTSSAVPPLFGLAEIGVTVNSNATPQVSAQDIFTINGRTATSQASVVNEGTQSGSYSVSAPTSGTASISSSGLVTYVPNAGFEGTDTIDISYTDNGNPALTGSRAITVAVASQPVATAPAISVANGGSSTSQISVSSNVLGRTYIFAIATPPGQGTGSVSNTGLVSYTPAAPYEGGDTFTVSVTDSQEPALFTTAVIPVTVTANHAPIASAPAISVQAGTSGISQVAVSDQDPGQSFSYSVSSAPTSGSATITSSGLITYTSTGFSATTDAVGITVTDNGTPNLSATISVPVTVTGTANQPPIIAGNLFYTIRSQGYPTMVNLSTASANSVSDPDGAISSMIWNFGDGTQEKTFDASSASINHNYVATGNFTATLTVTDNLGASASKQISVAVVDTDIPTAKFKVSPSNGGGGTVPLTVTFDASDASDSDGIVQYRWRFGNNASDIVTTNPIITHTFTAPGSPNFSYAVRLRTRDANAAQGEATVNVTVGGTSSGSQSIAQFVVGPPRAVVLGTPTTFDGSRSFNPNIGGTVATYNWNFANTFTCPNPNGGCTATGLTTSHTYPFVGSYFPSLQIVTGGGGTSTRVQLEAIVLNQGHAPRAVARFAGTSGAAPFTLNGHGDESYDYDGSLTSYTWFFTDTPGTPFNGSVQSHTFSAPGAYFATLQVRDADNNTHAISTPICVTPTGACTGRRDLPYDPDREYQRQILSGACAAESGEACSDLADMFAEDGNSYMAEQLKIRACGFGYQAACSR